MGCQTLAGVSCAQAESVVVVGVVGVVASSPCHCLRNNRIRYHTQGRSQRMVGCNTSVNLRRGGKEDRYVILKYAHLRKYCWICLDGTCQSDPWGRMGLPCEIPTVAMWVKSAGEARKGKSILPIYFAWNEPTGNRLLLYLPPLSGTGHRRGGLPQSGQGDGDDMDS